MKLKPSCSSKSRFLPSAILTSFLILVFSSGIAFAQVKIAVISKFNGEVKVIHEGKELVVEKIGNRVKNSSVYSDDSVITMHGANVDLVFLDNSRLAVKENTTLVISTKQITDAKTQKKTLRNIKINVGNLWASVTPSTSVLTEFETPSGVATIRGTEIGFDVGINPATGQSAVQVIMDDGSAVWAMPGSTFTTASGDIFTVGFSPDTGQISLNVSAGQIEANTGAGQVNMDAGDTVDIGTTATGETTLASVTGDVTVDTETHTIEMDAGDEIEVGVDTDGTATIEVTGGEVVATNTETNETETVETGETFDTTVTPPAPGEAEAEAEAEAEPPAPPTAPPPSPEQPAEDPASGSPST